MTGHGTSLENCTSGGCRASGVDLRFLRTGGDGPPLVALHGLMGSGACLWPLALTLRDGFDVILPDARGHGASGAPARGYRYGDLAGDVVALVGALALEAPVLLGHSMGGMTAAVAASRLGPSVAALVLVDPTFLDPGRQREVFESDVADAHRRSLASTRDELLAQARLRSPRRSEELLGHLVDARLRTRPQAFEVLTPPNPDYAELIRDLRVPTLLLLADRGVVSLETARALRSLNPLLRFELLHDAGHGVPYDDPERVGAAVSSFLRGT